MARRIARTTRLLARPWRDAIAHAAFLHDIGYAPSLVETGFHPIDGARWLRQRGWPDEVVQLVAWHTSSQQEAALLRFDEDLEREFGRPNLLAESALAWADLTSSPSGETWSAERRLADILDRHPSESIAHRATIAALPALRTAVSRIESLLAQEAL